ncbi:alanine racemase [Chryseobacterium sp. MFBS3-17]|uniref:alanine racemase n=1 Tax=Chryseobacterium sp. MFBS3-17 TaxID=2886689 RepID=UPI001D0DEF57|nr:alanine racemase [Chryseobacterium sp. MFBS3-17]MCC2589803.1 alanine racemase [Chryseobacterium sp. MFBS3-17]
MSIVTLNTKKLRENFIFLNRLFQQKNIEWSIVTKVLCGDETFLNEVLSLPINEFCDSRISNLRKIKELNPHAQTVYIKPVPLTSADEILQYADVSFNTEAETLALLSEKAVQAGKVHKIVIMIEMGELREGVVRSRLLDFFNKIDGLPHIEVVGIGTNLTCMNGVLPDYEKMRELKECKDEIEANFGVKIPYISGGASVAVPLIIDNKMPPYINHFRVGETLFFGTNVYDDSLIGEMHQDVFTLHAEIIEIKTKPNIPEGTLGSNLSGEQKDFTEQQRREKTTRAIVDVGLLDLSPSNIRAKDENLKIAGSSSDMMVLDLDASDCEYQVGDFIPFRINYMALLRLMSSDYVEKQLDTSGCELPVQKSIPHNLLH